MSTIYAEMMGSSKVKKKHLKPKHQKAKVFRANEPLLSVFMWGINHSIHGLTHVNIPVMLLPDDFKAFSKIRVDNHHFNKESMPSHFKVKEYCPLVFRNLRERFGIDDADYVNSLTKSQPVPADCSGKKFYVSYDKMFVIKVLQSEEVEQMHVLLKQYHPYIVERHGNTLLPQYLGMYRLTVEGAETYIVVMRNIFSSTVIVHYKYDLKGSSIDREASDKEKVKDLPTLKDNDFVRDGYKLHVGQECKDKLLVTLQADVDFLSRLYLVDYSLCLGIHDCDRAAEEALEKEKMSLETDFCSENGNAITEEDEDSAGSGVGVGPLRTPPDSPQTPRNGTRLPNGVQKSMKDSYAIKSDESSSHHEIYFLALVDVLTHYGVRKRTAQAAKTVKHGAGAEISTVHPDQYAKRLLDFMSKAML